MENKEKLPVGHQAVESSNIKSIAFFPEADAGNKGMLEQEAVGTLEVLFKNGAWWKYLEVTKAIHTAIKNSPSHGKAFNDMVKKNPTAFKPMQVGIWPVQEAESKQ